MTRLAAFPIFCVALAAWGALFGLFGPIVEGKEAVPLPASMIFCALAGLMLCIAVVASVIGVFVLFDGIGVLA